MEELRASQIAATQQAKHMAQLINESLLRLQQEQMSAIEIKRAHLQQGRQTEEIKTERMTIDIQKLKRKERNNI